MFLICGLGNPGKKYAPTRHNIGFEVIDYIAEQNHLSPKTKFNGQYFQHTLNGEKVIYLQPLTYMNLSGGCVRAFVDYFDIEPDKIMIIYDDTSFEPGTIRIRKTGSDGGHNGMGDILFNLGTNNICRIRLGIGQAVFDKKDYVLSRFTEEEIPLMQQAVKKAADAVKIFIDNGIDTAMNTMNTKTKKLTSDKEDE